MKKIMLTMVGAAGLFIASCTNDPGTMPSDAAPNALKLGQSISTANTLPVQAATDQIYFKGDPVSVRMRMITPQQAQQLLNAQPAMAELYVFSPASQSHSTDAMPRVAGDMSETFPFWREVTVHFLPGAQHIPLYRAEDILAASQGSNPTVALVRSNNVYHYSAALNMAQ